MPHQTLNQVITNLEKRNIGEYCFEPGCVEPGCDNNNTPMRKAIAEFEKH